MGTVGRRKVLGGAAAAAAAAATGARPAFAADAGGLPNGRANGFRATQASITPTLPALAPGEQAVVVASISLVAGGSVDGTPVGTVYEAGGAYPSSSGWVGTWISVPLGSLITGVDFALLGSPRTGLVTVERYRPDTVGFDGTVAVEDPSGSGAIVVSLATSEIYDGTQGYHAYHSGGSATSMCRGIRVRYVPPTSGFVGITPLRAYDSRLDMTPDAGGPLASGVSRTIHVSAKRDVTTGAIVGADALPPATAVAYTVTLANTTGVGFLAVNPGGTTEVSASAINWSGAGQFPANSSIVATGPDNTITVVAGGAGSTDVIIDVIGYFTG